MTDLTHEKDIDTPVKELDSYPGDALPRVPLDAVEQAEQTTKRTRYTQLLAIIVAGVALFSDGYNIQVMGEVFGLRTRASAMSDGN